VNRDDPGSEIPCRELVELLSDYLDGVVDEPVRSTVEAHLRGCRPCRVYLDQLLDTTQRLGRLAAIDELSATTRDDVLHAFRDLTTRR
jgi:predicted anti-sigma-YlaC factor YlaD